MQIIEVCLRHGYWDLCLEMDGRETGLPPEKNGQDILGCVNRDGALPGALCRILGYARQYFTVPVFTISPSFRQNQDPGRVCRADAGVGLLSAHRAPGYGKLGRGQAAPAGPGSSDRRWEAYPAGLPPGLPARRRAHRETHAVRRHLSLPRPSTHHRCQSGLQITICKKPPGTVERPYVSLLGFTRLIFGILNQLLDLCVYF